MTSKNSEAVKKMWQEKKPAIIERRKAIGMYENPARNGAISEKALARWADPEFRAKASAAMKAALKDKTRATYIPVTVDGVNYRSIEEAHRATGHSRRTIRKFLTALKEAE